MTNKTTYKATFAALINEGFRLTNYGGGIRYFAKDLQDGTCEVVAVRGSTGRIIAREIQPK